MLLWIQLQRWTVRHFGQLNGRNLLLAFFGYVILSWATLHLIGEKDLVASPADFVYYLVVTASTVGYGDMSPVTDQGKWFVSLFVIPFGLGLFAFSVGHITGLMIRYWKSSIRGKRSIKVNNHILILGWNEKRTLHLIKMLQYEEKKRRPIVLCVRPEIENPLPGDIDFVRVSSFTDSLGMDKAKIESASCVIIDNDEDDITLSAALFCASRNPDAHILAYFKDESLSHLLKQHCPHAECIPSVSVEMLAKAAADPGSSNLHHELLSAHKGMTQYSVTYPHTEPETNVETLFSSFKRNHEATLIAVDNGSGIELNPPLDLKVSGGSKIFYISDERVPHFEWK
jgi:voltage-gated potassium channel